MKRKCLLTISLLILGSLAIVSCGKKNNETPTTASEATTTSESTTTTEETPTTTEATTATEKPVTTEAPTTTEATTTEATTEEVFKPKVDKKTKGKGTFIGQADSHSIEIQLENSNYETFFIYDEKVADAFNNMDEGQKISFTYGPIDGQVNPEILSVKIEK